MENFSPDDGPIHQMCTCIVFDECWQNFTTRTSSFTLGVVVAISTQDYFPCIVEDFLFSNHNNLKIKKKNPGTKDFINWSILLRHLHCFWYRIWISNPWWGRISEEWLWSIVDCSFGTFIEKCCLYLLNNQTNKQRKHVREDAKSQLLLHIYTLKFTHFESLDTVQSLTRLRIFKKNLGTATFGNTKATTTQTRAKKCVWHVRLLAWIFLPSVCLFWRLLLKKTIFCWNWGWCGWNP